MTDLTPTQRATLTNAMKQLETTLAKIKKLRDTSANYFEEGKKHLNRANKALESLYKAFEQAANNQKITLTRARAPTGASRFGDFLLTLSFVMGYPGNHALTAALSMGCGSWGQGLQISSVPKQPTLADLPTGKSTSPAELARLFSNLNVFKALKEADSGKALLAMAKDLLALAHLEIQCGALYTSLNEIYIQINQLLDGRLNVTVSADSVIAAADRCSGIGKPLNTLSGALDKAEQLLTALDKAATACVLKDKQTGVREMERWIWVVWIANLKLGAWSGPGFAPTTINKRNADALDNDIIENRLNELQVIGPNSLLKVDFGNWTTNDDENQAVHAAFRLVYPGKPLPQAGRVGSMTR